MSRFRSSVDGGLRLLVVLLGVGTLYSQACVLLSASFATLRAFSIVPIGIAALIAWKTFGPSRRPEACPAGDRGRSRAVLGPVARFAIPVAICALYAVTRRDALFWLLGTAYLTAELLFRPREESAPESTEPPEPRGQAVFVLSLCLLAAVLTSGSRRPDADDAYFLNAATAEGEFPRVALQSFDALHRAGWPPVEQTLHLPESYEILVGMLASLSGLSVQALYYVVLPPIWAVLGVLASWLLLRELLSPRPALWGTAVFVFLLVFWGDGHRTFGTFGFVRLFQGKAVMITTILPLVILAGLRYRREPGGAAWLTLALAQCAAAGCTTNGVVVGPLAAALVLLAPTASMARSFRVTLAGLGASLPVLLVASAMYPRLAPYRSAVEVDGVLPGYSTTLGDVRAPLVLLALLLLPALASRARLRRSAWISGYVWIVVFVMLMPLVSIAGSRLLGHVYSWRLLWAVPLPLLVSLAVALAGEGRGERGNWTRAAAAVWAAAFVAAGPWAVSPDVFSLENLGRPKVLDAPYAVAREVLTIARRDAPALVPEAVAIHVVGFPQAPPLVAVRNLYLQKWKRFVPADQWSYREALFRYAEGGREAMSLSDALASIEAHGIATVVFPETHPDAPALREALRGRGFELRPVRGFLIATRS